MDWSNGFTGSIHAYTVDPRTWGDVEEILVESGTVDRVTDGLLETADLTIDRPIGESWIRVYMDARQAGASERVPVFTGLATSPKRSVSAAHTSYTAECSSVLKAASDVLLPRGWYAPAGYPAAKLAARLLGVFGIRCTFEDGAPSLTSAIVAEGGETNLSMAWKIANSIGWRIGVTGEGVVEIEPRPTSPVLAIGDGFDVVETSFTDESDVFSAPNVLQVTSGDATATARDDDPDSELSTATRGREVWATESDPELNSGESLSAYAQRRLRELQGKSRTVKVTRRFDPLTRPSDRLDMRYAGHGLAGEFRIDKQRIDLSANCKMTEEVTEC